jgi:hypothetical protein
MNDRNASSRCAHSFLAFAPFNLLTVRCLCVASSCPQVWQKFGPLSCLLNVDEVDDLQATWNYIGAQIGMDGEAVKQAVEPVKDLYTILDHTRSVLMAIEDVSHTHRATHDHSPLHPLHCAQTD